MLCSCTLAADEYGKPTLRPKPKAELRAKGDRSEGPTQKALKKLYRLLEEYAPSWYTREYREMAETAIARCEASLYSSQTDQGIHEFGGLRVDLRRLEVMLDGQTVHLTARELQLLRYLIERPDTAISRTELLQAVWGYDADSFTRTVDVHIAGLRKKLEKDPVSPQMIVTVRGMGYRFDRGR